MRIIFRHVGTYVGLVALLWVGGTQSATATQLQNGLISYWPFNDGVGTMLTDIGPAGSSNDSGTLRNSPTWLSGAAGKFNAGLQFNGTTQDVTLPTGGDMDINTNAVTLSAWVKLDQLPSELAGSFGGIFDSNQDNYAMYLDKGNKELRFKATNASAVSSATHPGIREVLLNKSDWLHVMGVYDGDKARVKLYFNGQLADITSLPNSTSGGTLLGPVRAGQVSFFGSQPLSATDSTPGSFFQGKISDVALWNRALGGAEAQYLYNSGAGNRVGAANPDIAPLPAITPVLPTAQPVVYYKFNGNLNNSGTGGAAYNAVLHDVAGRNDTLYTSSNFGQGLDLRENPVQTSSITDGGDFLSVDYTLPNSGTIMTRFTAAQLYNFNSLWSNSSHENDWEAWVYGDGRMGARGNRNTSIMGTSIWQLADPTAEFHVAFSWVRDTVDPTQVTSRFYINGEWVDERVGVWQDPGTTFFIGGGTGPTNGNTLANGVFDEFRIYGTALSEAEILYLSTHAPEVVVGLSGDYNHDGKVDAADYVLWRNDPAGNGGNPAGYNTWRANFGASLGSGLGDSAAVPEPAAWCLLAVAISLCGLHRGRSVGK
jgi:hypothetical protein